MDFEKQLSEYQNLINSYIEDKFAKFDGNKKLLSAMKYSLSAGGKRIRPVLLLAFCDAFGVDMAKALPFAFALECIHTSSLIHDDLPAMDNDDMRRGRPSNHKVFGEDFALIAGDALLNLAYETCLSACVGSHEVSAAKYLAECAGYSGMLGGQAYDMEWQFSDADESKLLEIDRLKTGKLLKAPIVMAGLLAGEDTTYLDALGSKLGVIFQFSDDLLDVVGDNEKMGKTLGKDEKEGKITAVTVYGIEGVRERIEKLKLECLEIADRYENFDFIKSLIIYVSERTS